jgi:hypothetical protein
MRIEGSERYQLTFTPEAFTVLCAKGTDIFSGLSTSDLPKLYIVSIDNKPIYVGITKQSMRNRLRLGWNAKGDSGYYGHAWRHGHSTAVLDVWCHRNAVDRNERDNRDRRGRGRLPDPRCRPMARVSDGNSFLSVFAVASRGGCRHHEALPALVGQWWTNSITSSLRIRSSRHTTSLEVAPSSSTVLTRTMWHHPFSY